MNQYRRFGSFATPEVTDMKSININCLKDWAGNFCLGLLRNVGGLKICNILVDLQVGSGGGSNHTQQAADMDDITLRAPLAGGARLTLWPQPRLEPSQFLSPRVPALAGLPLLPR